MFEIAGCAGGIDDAVHRAADENQFAVVFARGFRHGFQTRDV